MSREQDARIGQWVGIQVASFTEIMSAVANGTDPEMFHINCPCYSSDDQEAVTLLPILADRGYCPTLSFDDDGHWACSLSGFQAAGPRPGFVEAAFDQDMWKPTIAEAICHTVLDVIRQDAGLPREDPPEASRRALFRLHNEFDAEVVVCKDCLEIVNEGIYDERERYYDAQPATAGVCEYCG